MATTTKNTVLTALIAASGAMSEGLASIEAKRFTDTVAQYNTTSKAFWAAVNAYAPSDISRKAGDQDAVDAITAACKAEKLTWAMSASTISRLRTMRFHTGAETLAGFALYCGKQDVRQEIGQYVSYLGKLNYTVDGKLKPLVRLDGTLTNAGKTAKKKSDDRKAARKAASATSFDFAAFTTETGIAKAVALAGLIHDAQRELELVKESLSEADQKKIGPKLGAILRAKAAS